MQKAFKDATGRIAKPLLQELTILLFQDMPPLTQ